MLEDAKPTRVVMTVANPYTHDTRVEKEARTLAEGGLDVHVIAFMRTGLARHEVREGVTVHRIRVGGRYLAGLVLIAFIAAGRPALFHRLMPPPAATPNVGGTSHAVRRLAAVPRAVAVVLLLVALLVSWPLRATGLGRRLAPVRSRLGSARRRIEPARAHARRRLLSARRRLLSSLARPEHRREPPQWIVLAGAANRLSALLLPPELEPVHLAGVPGIRVPPAEARALPALAARVQRLVPSGEAIYVAPRRSDLVTLSDPLIHFLVRRPNVLFRDVL
ncbi:MAG: hypothetical protein MSC30_17545, partial [Gaiellaceae bacterium MAG52_C11]|nr:hypothetical protein [Candidatus Gaiellasilicea maunaloa]